MTLRWTGAGCPYSVGPSASTIRRLIGPDQPHFGQVTIPVVLALRSTSSKLRGYWHLGHSCALSHDFLSLGTADRFSMVLISLNYGFFTLPASFDQRVKVKNKLMSIGAQWNGATKGSG